MSAWRPCPAALVCRRVCPDTLFNQSSARGPKAGTRRLRFASEPACKPGSVFAEARDGHPSRARRCRRTRAAHQTASDGPPAIFWPCSGWGLPSRPGYPERWWSLTPPFHPYLRDRRRSALCCTCPRVTPGRRYRPPCPVEPGLSSAAVAAAAVRPTQSPRGDLNPGPLAYHASALTAGATKARSQEVCRCSIKLERL
jgi:hypothetical protein